MTAGHMVCATGWYKLVGQQWWQRVGLATPSRLAACLRRRDAAVAGILARSHLLGRANEAGVVTAQDQCADAAAGFICWQADEALLEVAGHGLGVTWACVPGRGGDHLVGRDLALAQLYPVHQ